MLPNTSPTAKKNSSFDQKNPCVGPCHAAKNSDEITIATTAENRRSSRTWAYPRNAASSVSGDTSEPIAIARATRIAGYPAMPEMVGFPPLPVSSTRTIHNPASATSENPPARNDHPKTEEH